MYKRLLIIPLVTLLLVGCSQDADYNKLKGLEPANDIVDSAVAYNTGLSKSEREQLIYQQVANRTLIDTTALDKVSSTETQEINAYMNRINNKIFGENNDSIPDNFVNYILFEMQKTPYEWRKKSIEIVGVDSATRNYVIDVMYETDRNSYKTKIQNSSIPLGCDNYDLKMQTRLNRYVDMLEKQISGDESYLIELEEFENAYGSVESIINTQSNYTLYEKAKQGEFVTYNCMTDSSIENSDAGMTVRFILAYEYALGVNLGLNCEHVYITNYALESDPTSNYTEANLEGSTALSDAVDTLIYSQNRAIDEDNYIGLYSLIEDFGKYDKYYYDMFNTSYRKVNGYAITIYEVNGTKIKAGVTRVRKIRTKGSNMSYPVYEEKWLYDIELIDNELKITNEVLIRSSIIGEPVIVDSRIEQTEGFNSVVTVKDTDKQKIEKVINDFSQLQVNYDTNSEDFVKVVDISTSAEELKNIKSDMLLVENAIAKATWIKSYDVVYSSYVTLTLKEVFYKEDGTALECESSLSLILKNNKDWQIIEYIRLSSASIKAENVSTDSASAYNKQQVDKVPKDNKVSLPGVKETEKKEKLDSVTDLIGD